MFTNISGYGDREYGNDGLSADERNNQILGDSGTNQDSDTNDKETSPTRPSQSSEGDTTSSSASPNGTNDSNQPTDPTSSANQKVSCQIIGTLMLLGYVAWTES